MRLAHRVRQALNLLNGSTALGVLVALAGRGRLRRAADGLLVAEDYRPSFPRAAAFTVGDVVVTGGSLADLEGRTPGVLDHEARHAWQYAVTGPWFLPLYLAASAWSWLRSGHPALLNAFERHAGLVTGGYLTADSPEPGAGWTVFRRWSGRSDDAPSARPGGAGAAGGAS